MNGTEISSEVWMSLAQKAWSSTQGRSAAELLAALRTQMATAPEAGGFTALAEGIAELTAYATADLGDDETSLDAEAEALQVARSVVRPVLEAKLQRRLDHLDAKMSGQSICPECHNGAESRGRRSRRWASLLGELTLRRRYAHCSGCGRGHAPAQDALGLPARRFTARLQEVCTLMATTVPFEMAVNLVKEVTGVRLSVKAAEDMIKERADKLARHLETEAAQCTPFLPSGLPVDEPPRPQDAKDVAPRIAYVEMDGVIPMTRKERAQEDYSKQERAAQKRAKQSRARGGKGRRYDLVGREVKNAVLYRGEDCAQETPSRGCLLDKHYVSYLGKWKTFADRLWAEMVRQRFDRAGLLVLISDGAEWIRSLAAWLPVSVLLILDLYHVKHRIWETAAVLYGDKTPKASAWAHAQCDRVESGHAKEVIEALGFARPSRSDAKNNVDALKTYLQNNLDRMDYPAYRKQGLRIGSGAVESANYHVTGARLKLQGMRWTERGARDMAHLRADLFNGRWEATTRAQMAA